VASLLLVDSGFADIEASGGWIISATVTAICDISSQDSLLDDAILAGELSPKGDRETPGGGFELVIPTLDFPLSIAKQNDQMKKKSTTGCKTLVQC